MMACCWVLVVPVDVDDVDDVSAFALAALLLAVSLGLASSFSKLLNPPELLAAEVCPVVVPSRLAASADEALPVVCPVTSLSRLEALVLLLAAEVCPSIAAIRPPAVAALPLSSAADNRPAALLADVLVPVLSVLLARLSSVDSVLAVPVADDDPVPSNVPSDELVELSSTRLITALANGATPDDVPVLPAEVDPALCD